MFNVQKWLMQIANKISKKIIFYENYTKTIVKSRQMSWCDSFFSMMIISLFSNRKYFLIVCRVEKDIMDLNQCLPSAVWYHWEMHWAWRSQALPSWEMNFRGYFNDDVINSYDSYLLTNVELKIRVLDLFLKVMTFWNLLALKYSLEKPFFSDSHSFPRGCNRNNSSWSAQMAFILPYTNSSATTKIFQDFCDFSRLWRVLE